MRAAGLNDADGPYAPENLAAGGVSFRITGEGGTGVFVAEKRGGELWILGAGSVKSKGMTRHGMGVVEEMARQSNCTCVAFETERRGLMRLATKNGYRVRSVVMKKKVC